MPGIKTFQKIAVIRTTSIAMEIETYDSPLDLVEGIIGSGSLGGPLVCFGDKEHKAALRKAAAHIKLVLSMIREQENQRKE